MEGAFCPAGRGALLRVYLQLPKKGLAPAGAALRCGILGLCGSWGRVGGGAVDRRLHAEGPADGVGGPEVSMLLRQALSHAYC